MRKVLTVSLVAALLLILVASPVLASAETDKSPPANFHLAKKVTLQGEPAPKGKPARGAATGILGVLCSGSKYAIVIGISDYPGTENDLNYADDDADDMSTALTTIYGYSESNIHLLKDSVATKTAIQGAISSVTTHAKPGDEVVFFFSGHGGYSDTDQDGDGEVVDEAIVSHDGTNLVAIWDGELRSWFSGLANKGVTRIIFIFDSCMAGGMTDLAATGRVINMACGETELAAEWWRWGGGHGQFTYYFVDEGMLQGWADIYDHDGDGISAKRKSPGESSDVAVEEAFDYAYKKCRGQTPVISDSFKNDLLP